MSGPLDEVVAGLRAAADRLDTAVAVATRARADAEQGVAHYGEAGRGSGHPDIRAAVEQAREAAAKAGKVGRLLAEAAGHLIGYANVIAPGSVPSGTANDTALPSGEDLVSEAESRGRRFDVAFRKQMKKADDTEDTLKSTEDATKLIFSIVKEKLGPHGGTKTGTQAKPTPPAQERPDVENPATAVIMAAGALAVAAKAMWNHGKSRRAGKSDDDQA